MVREILIAVLSSGAALVLVGTAQGQPLGRPPVRPGYSYWDYYQQPEAPPEYDPAAPAAGTADVDQQRLEEAIEAYMAQREGPQRPAADGAEQGEEEGYVVGSDLGMKASWRNGLEIESANKDFRVHIGGRTQVDGVWLDAEGAALAGAGGVGDEDSVNFRRARLRADGTMYEIIDWAVEYDFVNNVNDNAGLQPASETLGNVAHVPAPTDLWFNIESLPLVGNVRMGNMKEPIGLEHLTSSRYLDFMERSFNQDAFTGPFNNGFTPGIMLWNTSENRRFHWDLGVFKNTNNVFGFGVGDGEYAADGRVTVLPWFDEASGGRYLMHLGAWASHRDLDDGRIRFRSRASLRNGPGVLNPNLADTGFFFGDDQDLAGAEAALVLGPLLLQSEYIVSYVTDALAGGADAGTVFFNGYYVEALYFLTGEHRAYDHERGSFGRVVPHENFYWVRGERGNCLGRGAWQVGARYGKLDLRDSGIDGGVIQDVTLGLNWFLNPNMKLQWNYVFTHRDAAGTPEGGDIHGAGMRLAHDF